VTSSSLFAISRESVAGEIVVPASHQLGQLLWEHDLVDELRLVVFPVVLGQGTRLFGTEASPRSLRLVETRTVGTGLRLLRYRRV
jgi:dihydrofolate reductase